MITIVDQGSLVLVRPSLDIQTPFWDWVNENIGEYQSWGNSLVVEPRYVENLLFGLESEGFQVA